MKFKTGVFLLFLHQVVISILLTFFWNPKPGVKGYKLYFGSIPGDNNGVTKEGIQSPITIPVESLKDPNNPMYVLAVDRVFWFRLTAYTDEEESKPSAEVNNANLPVKINQVKRTADETIITFGYGEGEE